MKRFTYKYGLEVPRNIAYAYDLDKRKKNMLWADAIKQI